MIIATIGRKRLAESFKLASKVLKDADVIELRIDALDNIIYSEIKHFIQSYPTLLTFRSFEEGGLNKKKICRETVLKELIRLKPAYIDLEFERDQKWIFKVASRTKVILSFHTQEYSHFDIEKKLLEMKQHPAWKYKIATHPSSILDSMRMLFLVQKHADFIGICMGRDGTLTRLLGPCLGQKITYGSADDEPLAEGQLCVEELKEHFQFNHLNNKTKILGIIGTPLTQSPGVKIYNAYFSQNKINAIYLNFELKEGELALFLEYAKKLAFYGLSVTHPYKEKALAFSQREEVQKEVEAVNTLTFKENKIMALNSDVIAAEILLKRLGSIKNKKVLVLGAGGVAKPLAFMLKKENAKLIFINRTKEKAQEMARTHDGTYLPFEKRLNLKASDYDILIQSTSVGMDNEDSLLPSKSLHNGKIILEVIAKKTSLQKMSHDKNCAVINGKEFWVEQAAVQFESWIKKDIKHFKNFAQKQLL